MAMDITPTPPLPVLPNQTNQTNQPHPPSHHPFVPPANPQGRGAGHRELTGPAGGIGGGIGGGAGGTTTPMATSPTSSPSKSPARGLATGHVSPSNTQGLPPLTPMALVEPSQAMDVTFASPSPPRPLPPHVAGPGATKKSPSPGPLKAEAFVEPALPSSRPGQRVKRTFSEMEASHDPALRPGGPGGQGQGQGEEESAESQDGGPSPRKRLRRMDSLTPVIDPTQLQIVQLLGQGSCGQIYKANWLGTTAIT